MSLHTRFRTHTATVARGTRTSDSHGGFTRTFADVGTVTGSLQPAGAAETSAADMERAQARWLFFTDPGEDIRRDDRLTISDRAYTVLDVARWDADSVVDHDRFDLEEIQKGT